MINIIIIIIISILISIIISIKIDRHISENLYFLKRFFLCSSESTHDGFMPVVMHFWRNMTIMAFLKKDDHDDMKSRVLKRFNCNDKDQSTHKGFLSLLPRVSGEICLR